MASSCPSQDQQNFECVTIASVDFIKLPLKDILESHIQPVDLFKEINSCPALSSHKHKLRQDQLKLCFLQPPAEPDYRKFDVTLLYTLIRNLCPSVKPTKGWGTQPDDADRLGMILSVSGCLGTLTMVMPVLQQFLTLILQKFGKI